MFNTSNHSSERSMRRESSPSQRGPSTQRSRSVRSRSSSRHSEGKPPYKAPPWVHCEKCYCTDDLTAKMILLTCGHIFCRSCLRVDHSLLLNELVPCPRCKIDVAYRPIDGSMDAKLHGMFEQSWTDPILKINLKHMQFMFTKTQNYSKYLSKNVKQNTSIPSEYMERYNNSKKFVERIQKMQKFDNELNAKMESLKAEACKRYKNVQHLRALYQRKKTESLRQPQSQYQKTQGNYQQNMKLISSGRNEQTNQYIDQVKTSHWPTNQNQSAAEIRNLSKKVTPAMHRQSTSLNQYNRDSSSKQSSDYGAKRPAMPSATFRPKPKDFASDNRRFEPQPPAQKRLVPSYGYDEHPTPSKRPAHFPVRREINLDTSVSSVGSSAILNANPNPYIPMPNFNNRPKNTLRVPAYK